MKLDHIVNPKIYLDLDGVVSNFNKKFKELTGKNPKDLGGAFHDVFGRLVKDHDFFSTLEPMPGYQDLVRYIKKYDVEVLTAAGQKNFEMAKKQKEQWVKRHLGYLKVHVVKDGPDKKEFATANSILIDDTDRNISAFNGAGGHGILHTTNASTIKQLKALGL